MEENNETGLALVKQARLDLKFTDIKGYQLTGSAVTRFTMKWGEYHLKRVQYSPYGNPEPAIWHLGETIISNITFEDIGNDIAVFLESKWASETQGIAFVMEKI